VDEQRQVVAQWKRKSQKIQVKSTSMPNLTNACLINAASKQNCEKVFRTLIQAFVSANEY
jgi:hypothetical protein